MAAKKKDEKVKEEEKKETKAEAVDRNKEIKWILIIMAVFLATVLIVYFWLQSTKHFEYEGMSFSREKFGKIDVYHYYYYFNKTNQIYQYNLYLRGDPRDNRVPVVGDKISFYNGKLIYVSINGTGFEKCEDASIAIAGLTSFLADNKMEIKGATPDKNEALNKSIKFATCQSENDSVVIEVYKSNQTEIVNSGNCHMIRVADCDILPATEKFVVQAILDAKSSQ